MAGHPFFGPKSHRLHFHRAQHLGLWHSEAHEGQTMFSFLLGSTGLFANTAAGRAGRVERMFKSLAPALAAWRVKSQPLENHTVHTSRSLRSQMGVERLRPLLQLFQLRTPSIQTQTSKHPHHTTTVLPYLSARRLVQAPQSGCRSRCLGPLCSKLFTNRKCTNES